MLNHIFQAIKWTSWHLFGNFFESMPFRNDCAVVNIKLVKLIKVKRMTCCASHGACDKIHAQMVHFTQVRQRAHTWPSLKTVRFGQQRKITGLQTTWWSTVNLSRFKCPDQSFIIITHKRQLTPSIWKWILLLLNWMTKILLESIASNTQLINEQRNEFDKRN